jgi:hypothetical protein
MRGAWKRGNLRSDGVGSSWVAGVLLVRALQDTLLRDNHGLDARIFGKVSIVEKQQGS